MATKKQTLSERKEHISHELYKIRCLVGLCGFAAEARRILTDISVAVEIDNEFGVVLDEKLIARNEWLDHADDLAEVLKEVSHQIESVIVLADGLGD